MGILIGLVVFVFVLLAAGIFLVLKLNKKNEQVNGPVPESVREIPSECCGAHEVCEFEELIVKSQEIVYFEDEELDRFKGRNGTDYSDEQIDEFRDVLYTLLPKEINSWLKSLESREIQLPSILNQEARQLIADGIKTKKAS
ncbi:MAG: hypothetical protein A2W90_22030 [Bacteroidetes bacterium GWF2_42_66]|nr:MAG: hypothetical protein A2W92_04845 [Bacteroidetes bacterium GWA2_42_15]OFY03234.1 MAG: hypothetical protein A2W89_18830 [Bacteroidetes bacterium GWE2_42_39]OFY45716.1 MAG: hypothetical protein A2W90_22030 [Bacteroidetes bacterium GWF2_42_66]HBL77291.1 phospholipase [Prolixibacteraceae bacterium]HCU62449.1 phospholipase [Prolixibacteraceae bacterium]